MEVLIRLWWAGSAVKQWVWASASSKRRGVHVYAARTLTVQYQDDDCVAVMKWKSCLTDYL